MEKCRLFPLLLVLILFICSSGIQGQDQSASSRTANHLLIEGTDGWTKHLEVPQGTTAYLVVLAKKEGIGCLNDLYPDGSFHKYDYYFCSYDRLPFYANTPGRHVLSYIIDDSESNPVVMDVIGAYTPIDSPSPYVAPIAKISTPTEYASPRFEPVSLSRGISSDPMILQHYPVGSHVMNYQNRITTPQFASHYYFGRDFSLGIIDSNYPGTPFLTQFLADP